MSRIHLLVFFIAAAMPATVAWPADETDEQIRAAFGKYREALLEGDGQAAWQAIDRDTQNYYSQAVKDALMLSKKDFEQIDFMRKLLVVRMRHEFRKSELEKLTGQKAFAHGVKQGWIDKSAAQRTRTIEKLKVQGDTAAGYLPLAPNTPAFHFVKMDGAWKLSLVKGLPLANAAFDQLRKAQDVSEQEFISQLLQLVSGREVDAAIYDGPRD